jgi:hypothetical protein
MAKKTFKGGMDNLLGETPKATPKKTATPPKERGRPKTNFKVISNTSEIGTKENETRATFIVNKELLLKIQSIAYWERIKIKEVLDKALEEAVSKYEKKNGVVKTMPKI